MAFDISYGFRGSADTWVFELSDSAGRVIKTHAGRGLVPDHIIWDGVDTDGSLVPARRHKGLRAKFSATCEGVVAAKEIQAEDPFACTECMLFVIRRKNKDKYVFYEDEVVNSEKYERRANNNLLNIETYKFYNFDTDWCFRRKCDDESGASIDFDGIETVFVKGGTFTMGCTPEQEEFCDGDELPAHEVTVSSFHIAKYPLTQKQWLAVMGRYPPGFDESKGPDLPMVVERLCLPQFLDTLNARTGKKYRMATEAEWEYAARGGARSKGYIFAGSDRIDDVAWTRKAMEYPVNSKSPNELGIYGMTGNIGEWVSDCYGRYGRAPQTDPKGPPAPRPCKKQVYRGGDPVNLGYALDTRVSSRGRTDSFYTDKAIRLVLENDDTEMPSEPEDTGGGDGDDNSSNSINDNDSGDADD
jgi:hypothetical protein